MSPPKTTPSSLQPVVRELRARLKDLYGDRLHTMVLNGSHARYEATDASDVDIMVVLEGTLIPGRN